MTEPVFESRSVYFVGPNQMEWWGVVARLQWMGEIFVSKETKKGNTDDSFPSPAIKFGREKCKKYEDWGKFVVLT